MKHIIQIGACGGNDQVTQLLQKTLIDTKAHLIEPLPHNFEQLKQNYSSLLDINTIFLYNCAISTYTGEITLYNQTKIYNNPTQLDEHCSTSYQHMLAHGHKDNISSFIINCYTLNDFVLMNNISGKIKHLFLDTEGHDCDILLSTNFENLDIEYITFETVHSDGPFSASEKLQKTIEYLQTHSFRVVSKDLMNHTLKKF